MGVGETSGESPFIAVELRIRRSRYYHDRSLTWVSRSRKFGMNPEKKKKKNRQAILFCIKYVLRKEIFLLNKN